VGQLFIQDASLSQAQRESIERSNNNPRTPFLFDESISGSLIEALFLRPTVRALQSVPGRKSLIYMSSQITFRRLNERGKRNLNELIDLAWRAGVVIHTLDLKGLTTWNDTNYENYVPFSEKTGGLLLVNSNFFVNGVGRVNEALKGFYMLSFVPPSSAFENNRPNAYHQVRVKVKRSGAEVHARDGYFAVAHVPSMAGIPKDNALVQAILNPFFSNDFKLTISAGYAHAEKRGYFLQTWLNLEGKDLSFKQIGEGQYSLSMDAAILTSDSDGNYENWRPFKYDLTLNSEDVARIRKEGIDISLYSPVKKPGNYRVFAAAADRASGNIGTCYQTLDIPDLGANRLSLSSIFMISQEKEAAEIKSGDIDAKNQEWRQLKKSPTLRIYHPGEGLNYMAVIYNAKSKEGRPPKLEYELTIYKEGGSTSYGNDREALDLQGIEDYSRIPIVKKLILNSNMEEGKYTLELRVQDKQADRRSGFAFQFIDFEIRKD
jgi:hypothetical protein